MNSTIFKKLYLAAVIVVFGIAFNIEAETYAGQPHETVEFRILAASICAVAWPLYISAKLFEFAKKS